MVATAPTCFGDDADVLYGEDGNDWIYTGSGVNTVYLPNRSAPM